MAEDPDTPPTDSPFGRRAQDQPDAATIIFIGAQLRDMRTEARIEMRELRSDLRAGLEEIADRMDKRVEALEDRVAHVERVIAREDGRAAQLARTANTINLRVWPTVLAVFGAIAVLAAALIQTNAFGH